MHVLFGPTLVVHDDVVLFAGGEKLDPIRGGNDTMTALSARSGETLWSAPHPASGYASAEDLFVIGGLVWCGVTSSPRDSGVFTGRDLHTGEVRREFPPDDWRHMPHHRCHRAKATSNYILTSRTGIEFVDLQAEHWTAHHWVRGSCNYGILPCNGLVYAPPHSCACYLLAKLNGLNALAPQRTWEGDGNKAEGGRGKLDASSRLEKGAAFEDSSPSAFRLPPSEDWPTYRHDAARSGAATTVVPVELKRRWQADLGARLTGPVIADGRLYVAAIDEHTVHALASDTGKPLWRFTAGARVDSPPTVWQGRVLFGSRDGWVYCLRADDGAMVWRFRAAPADQRLVAQEQVESVWPVPGSVLVHEGVVYCVAGRAMWLDGGLRLVRLDARTGRKLSETVLDDKYPGTEDNLQRDIKWPNLPVALPDVLSCDGRYVYMRSQPFDLDGNRTEVITPRNYEEQRGETAHLFSPTGFLDDSWWHRTCWVYGRSFISGAGGWYLAGYRAPTGAILVVDASSVYGFGKAPLRANGTPNAYHLFACPKEPEIINPNPRQEPRKQGTSIFGKVIATRPGYDWSRSAPLLARAMTLAGQTLFVAGPPALVDEDEVYQRYADPAVQERAAAHVAAFEGRRGALRVAVSQADGTKQAAYRLDSPPVFDGVAAARGHLFLSTMDGKVLCLGGGGQPLTPAVDADLGPAAATASVASRAAAGRFQETATHPDFQALSAVQVTPSGLGYHVQAASKATGLALRKLDKPLLHRATFRLRLRPVPGATSPDKPGNGFLVFGNSPDEEKLVKCGFRISGKSLYVIQGPLSKGKTALQRADVKANVVTEMEVVVDLDRQKVTLAMLGQTVEAPIAPRLEAVAWVGYCVSTVACEFGPIEIAGD